MPQCHTSSLIKWRVNLMDEAEDEDAEAPQLCALPEPPPLSGSQTPTARVIPVTIITGYLGSGKSTLLNFLLRSYHGKRLAIIENEFSAGLGIEGMIAKSGVDDSNLGAFFELNNGCLCCTVKGELLVTLEQLVLHKDRFDYIIIETTGVANPGPVISTFWTDESLGSSLKLDGVVCVVDSSNMDFYMQALDVSSDIRTQISYADRILLNKSDLVSAEQLERILQQVREMNRMADIRATTFANVGCEWILDIDCYSLRNPLESMGGVLMAEGNFCFPCGEDDGKQMLSSHPAAINPSHSATTLSSCNLSFPGTLDLPKLKLFLDSILYDNGRFIAVAANSATSLTPHADADTTDSSIMRIFRMKGILHIQGEPFLHILQAVHDIFDIQPSLVEKGIGRDASSGLNHIIVIGRNVDKKCLYNGLQACVC